ncbi:triose-phosphate isomerase family protein [Streptomyces decoyicus]|uniref:triose-phosphate isomerase family protein n=1 Tax=Streptomyces decoyicus TaxID=249567 RepID=UPI0033AD2B21
MIPENSPSAAGPRPVIGVSLKLHFGLARTRAWLAEVAALDATLAALPRPVDLFVLPSFPALADARELLGATRIAFGAQNVHWADTGAFTGEVSAGMLAEAGARYVEVGHAERRRHVEAALVCLQHWLVSDFAGGGSAPKVEKIKEVESRNLRAA